MRISILSLTLASAAGALFVALAPAQANTYNLTGDGNISIFSATVTTGNVEDPSYPGGYDITGISGSVTGFGTISGLIPASQFTVEVGGGTNIAPTDNVFYPSPPFFDSLGTGFYFSLVDQTDQKLGGGIWYIGNGQYSLFIGDWLFYQNGGLNISAGIDSQTPLPAALPMFATGLGALGLLGWRRKRKVAARAA